MWKTGCAGIRTKANTPNRTHPFFVIDFSFITGTCVLSRQYLFKFYNRQYKKIKSYALRSYIYFNFLLLMRKHPSTCFYVFGNMSFHLHTISDPHLDFLYIVCKLCCKFLLPWIRRFWGSIFLLMFPISLERFLMTHFWNIVTLADRWPLTLEFCSRFVLT